MSSDSSPKPAKPASIDRQKIVYVAKSSPAAVKAPRPVLIDRSRVSYSATSAASNTVTGIKAPQPTSIDASKVSYASAASDTVSGVKAPQPKAIDRAQVSYTATAVNTVTGIKAPSAASINAADVTYAVAAPQIPKAPGINAEKAEGPTADQVKALEEKGALPTSPSGAQVPVLEKNIQSPKTPGEAFFPKFAVDEKLEKEADRRIAQYPKEEIRSAVLPLLHDVQHRFGFISPEAIDWVAGKLDIQPIKVVEVVTFYPGFRQKAPGRIHFRVCRTLSCAMGGSYELMDKLCQLTKIDRSDAHGHKDPISVSPCGNYSVEFAECLASCGTAPVCLVNDDFHENITDDKAQALIDQYQPA